jgi:hypothetical protein
MPAFDAADTHVSKRAHCASKAPIMISQTMPDKVPADTVCFMFSGLASRVRSCRTCSFLVISLCSTRQAESLTSSLCGVGSGFPNSPSQQLHRVLYCGIF